MALTSEYPLKITRTLVVQAIRLSGSGAVSRALLFLILTNLTPNFPISTAELAELAQCHERCVPRELGALAEQGVILWRQPRKGWNIVQALVADWPAILVRQPLTVESMEVEQ